ncbi:hypothetical protein HOD83_03605 [Candidatus Woesearchaeota archaeon]|jgi:hypothetical protein|nr:hypothetical protein [Candidatus Woesearchaeota archaeon]MBT4248641.1 hypothetical protein [Candidatus Woesearchaeota archaeon]
MQGIKSNRISFKYQNLLLLIFLLIFTLLLFSAKFDYNIVGFVPLEAPATFIDAQTTGAIEINKPVRWISQSPIPTDESLFALRGVDKILLSVYASNIQVLDSTGSEINDTQYTVFETDTTKEIIFSRELPLDQIASFEISYELPGPQVKERQISTDTKQVTVYSDLAYQNVKTYTTIANAPSDAIKLFWYIDDVRTDVTADPEIGLSMQDTDGDTLIDYLEWTTPHLSNQTFEIELLILNPVTYLRDGETWIVAFNTTGTSNLNILSPNASWEEIQVDLSETSDEMDFLSLKCGETSLLDQLKIVDAEDNVHQYTDILGGDSIKPKMFLVENYSCSETAYFSNLMNIAGYAALEFRFGGQVAYAYDPPGVPYVQEGYVFNSTGTVFSADVNITNVNLSQSWFTTSSAATGYYLKVIAANTSHLINVTANCSASCFGNTVMYANLGTHPLINVTLDCCVANCTFQEDTQLLQDRDCTTMDVYPNVVVNTSIYSFNITSDANISGTLNASLGGAQQFGNLTINSSGTYHATGGTTFIGDDLRNLGSSIHNNGAFQFITSVSNSDMNGNLTTENNGSFYDLVVNKVGSGRVRVFANMTVENELNVTDGYIRPQSSGANTDRFWTFGTASSAGRVNMNLVNSIQFYLTNANNFTVQSASESYPVVLVGNDFRWSTWDDGGTTGIMNFKWVDFRSDLTTGYGSDIVILGDSSFGNLTINGSETLNTSTFVINTTGALVVNGTFNASFGGNHSFNSLTINASGTYHAPTGTTTVTGNRFNNSGTFIHNGGWMKFTGPAVDVTGQTIFNATEISGNVTFNSDMNHSVVNVTSVGNLTYNATNYDNETVYYKESGGYVWISSSSDLTSNQTYFNGVAAEDQLSANTTGVSYYVDEIEAGSGWNVTGWGEAPTIISARIAPNQSNTTDILEGWCNATDSNGDTLNYYYQWYNNSVLVEDGYNSTSFTQGLEVNVNNLSSVNTSKWESWNFSCLATDGAFNSSWVNDSITINNSAPTTPTSLTPTAGTWGGTYNDTMLVNCSGSTDVDGDMINYTIETNWTGSWVVLATNLTEGNHSWNISTNDSTSDFGFRCFANDSWKNSSYYMPSASVNIDNQAPEYSDNRTNTTNSFIGNDVEFNLTWADDDAYDVGLSGFIFSTNDSGSWVNYSEYDFGAQTDSNYTINITGYAGLTVGWRFYANDTYNNLNESEIFKLDVQNKSIAVQLLGFTNGIVWSNAVPNATDNPADGNNLTGITNYTLNISEANGTKVNIFLAANDSLKSGADTLDLTKEKLANSTSDDTVPSEDNRSLTTTYSDNKVGDSLISGSSVYMKFFITIPTYQATGEYTNNITFKALMAGVNPDV